MPRRERVAGVAELDRTLRRILEAAEPKAVQRALRAGAKPIEDEAKRLAPVQTGALRESIDATAAAITRSGTIQISVAPNGVNYADDVEFGSRGRAAQPFMRPAFDVKSQEAIRAISRELAADIKRRAKG